MFAEARKAKIDLVALGARLALRKSQLDSERRPLEELMVRGDDEQ